MLCRRALLQNSQGLEISSTINSNNAQQTQQAYNSAVNNGALADALRGLGLSIVGQPSTASVSLHHFLPTNCSIPFFISLGPPALPLVDMLSAQLLPGVM